MTDSIKGQILTALQNRLTTITAANGYSLTVKKVYCDKIPMGAELNKQHLPAIFLLEGPDPLELEQSTLKGNWDIRMQLWHNGDVGDIQMIEFTRAVLKAVYANSPTAQVSDAFRALHKSVTEFVPLSISPDLNMIDGNRVSELSFVVRYRTKLFDL